MDPVHLGEISTVPDAEYSSRTTIVAPLTRTAPTDWQAYFEIAANDYPGLRQRGSNLLVGDRHVWVTVMHDGVAEAMTALAACVEQTNADLATYIPPV